MTTLPRARPSPTWASASGTLVEPEGAVDVDAHVTGDAQVGQRLEVGGARLYGEHAEAAAGDQPTRRADREHPQQRSDGPADTSVPAAGSERSTVGEDRPMGDEIEDQVVGFVDRG